MTGAARKRRYPKGDAPASPELAKLVRLASRLAPSIGRSGSRLPRIVFFTDPARTDDPVGTLSALPSGAGVVYRAFGRPDAVEMGRRLRIETRRRGLMFLVGADEGLAAALGADGLHLPERLIPRAERLRRRRPLWTITAAAHSARALARARRSHLDAAFLSPACESRSVSAGRPLGILRFALLTKDAKIPVYALGGVTGRTAPRLRRAGAFGFAGVEVFQRGPHQAFRPWSPRAASFTRRLRTVAAPWPGGARRRRP